MDVTAQLVSSHQTVGAAALADDYRHLVPQTQPPKGIGENCSLEVDDSVADYRVFPHVLSIGCCASFCTFLPAFYQPFTSLLPA